MLTRYNYFFLLFFIGSLAGYAQEQEITNSVGITLVLIQPGKMRVGEFRPPYPVPADTIKNAQHTYVMWMGEGRGYSAEDFARAREMALRDSRPGFDVTIEKAFYIGKFEITQAQWRKVMGTNPSQFGNGSPSADSLPVEQVTWNDAKKFVARLNKLEGRTSYRLPTESEWEYAARAGAEKDIPWREIEAMANLNKRSTEPVGRRSPNAWGLYDMLGNVWEWVEDVYNEKIFPDEVPMKKGKQHVLKGASFTGDVKNATYMTHAGGPGNGWDVGFRIVMEVK